MNSLSQTGRQYLRAVRKRLDAPRGDRERLMRRLTGAVSAYLEENPEATPEELAAAHRAALDYYRGTVFEVETLTEIEPRQGEIAFQVSCSKGGAKVDPDRTISLERQDGVWTVISEGY